MHRRSREMTGQFLTCVGILALLVGLDIRLVENVLGLVLAAGGALAALLAIAGDVRWGVRPARSATYVLLAGALTGGLVFGIVWFSAGYLPAHPSLYPRLFPFPTAHP